MRLDFHAVLIFIWALICSSRRMQLERISQAEDGSPISFSSLATLLLASSRGGARVASLRRHSAPVAHHGPIPHDRTVEPVAIADDATNIDEAVPQKEQKAPPSELLQSLADASSSPEDLKNLMEESFDKFSQEDIESIYSLANEDEENVWKEVLDAFEYVKRTKLLGGKDLLQELLEAGEIRKLDSMVAKAVKDGKITPAFLKVITDNMKAAREEGPEIKANLLTHIYTVVTEELEKATSPGLGLVSRLMRQEDPGIRSNLLNHYLRPQTEILLPDGEKIQLKEPKAALVHPMQFSEGITETVIKLRSMNIQDEELIAGMVEDVRRMAKEGRVVVVEAYPESVVDEFSDSLTPVFKPAAYAAAAAR